VEDPSPPKWRWLGASTHARCLRTVQTRQGSQQPLSSGLRYRFGRMPPRKPPCGRSVNAARQAAESPESPRAPRSLPEALKQAAMGGGAQAFQKLGPEPSPKPLNNPGAAPLRKNPSVLNLRQQRRDRTRRSCSRSSTHHNVQARETGAEPSVTYPAKPTEPRRAEQQFGLPLPPSLRRCAQQAAGLSRAPDAAALQARAIR